MRMYAYFCLQCKTGFNSTPGADHSKVVSDLAATATAVAKDVARDVLYFNA